MPSHVPFAQVFQVHLTVPHGHTHNHMFYMGVSFSVSIILFLQWYFNEGNYLRIMGMPIPTFLFDIDVSAKMFNCMPWAHPHPLFSHECLSENIYFYTMGAHTHFYFLT